MKFRFLSLLLLAGLGAIAQSDKYVDAMKKNLAMFGTVKTTAEYQSLANNFERIAEAEKTQWLPYYYAGLALTTPAWADTKVDKDANSTKVLALCDKAEALDKNSEIEALRNMAYTQQMLVDPQTRWQTYGTKAHAALESGMKMDPENPRLYFLQGESLMGTPEAFGGGKEKAKPLFQKSIDLFAKAQPKPMYPDWGAERAKEDLAKCQ